jgi:small subunit ribosomal protein S4
MARYTEAVCRLCRRENQKLFLKGDRCYSAKCPVVKRGTAPGQHAKSRRKTSEYGLQLREKQKARRTYGMLEKQFHSYFTKATNMKGAAGENMLQLLERRLDNVVYRLGFGDSRAQARQIVNHGHITVNGKKVIIPSFIVKAGDVIAIAENSTSIEKFKAMKKNAEITEDDMKDCEKKVQDLTDKFCADVDKEVAAKEKEVMSI